MMARAPAGRLSGATTERRAHIGQIIRYLAVGGWNTAFSYGLFAGLNYLLTGVIPYAYLAANLLASVIAISGAFFGYKFFVFKTRGNYLREYLRTYVVYGVSCASSLLLLWVAVPIVGSLLRDQVVVPYVAQAIVVPIVVLLSYLGHKQYSFRA